MSSNRSVSKLMIKTAIIVAVALQVPGFPLSPLGSHAHAVGIPAVSSTVNQFGFPDWYQDTTGARVEPCIAASDPMCTVLPAPGVFDPTQPLTIPTNFPPEFFYTLADSVPLTTSGCNGTTAPGKAFVRLATEGAFVNGDPVPGEQTAFGRVRIVVSGGLCANHDYTVNYPFGSATIHTNGFGALDRQHVTTDVGCLLFAPPATCDFTLALGSPVVQNFLRWDPAVAPAAPAGYLGDPAIAHAITGGTAGNANAFSVVDAGVEVLRTDQFTVMGKEAGPITASTGLVEFGPQHVNLTSPAKSVTLTNVAATPVTLGTFTTTPAGRFTVTDPNLCANRVLARDASCAVSVTFSPLLVGGLDGTLTVTSTGGPRSPFVLALAGTGTNPGQEALINAVPASVVFAPVRIRVQSPSQRITINNTGTAPLLVSATDLVDTTVAGDRFQFAVIADACRGISIKPNGKCDVTVVARPTANGAITAALKLTANISLETVQIPLSATGTGGIAAVSTAIDAGTGYPEWYQDEVGVRLSECVNPADPGCTVLADPFFNPALPLIGVPSFSNFPTEFFYHVATSDIITTPGCAGTAPGVALMRSALEGAFVNGDPINGDQMTFGRIRLRVSSGLCPNTPYTFTHPYGQVTFTTNAAGGLKPAAGTSDVGCFPVAPATCDWTQAVLSPVSGGFLKWDPAVAPAAPAGYLGNPLVLHTVSGSGFIAPGETTPANYFRINGPTVVGGASVQIGKTSLFTVMGKLNGPLVPSRTGVLFAAQPLTATSAPTAVTFKNEGIASVTVTSATVTGTNLTDFAADPGCVGVTLAVGASCVINVTFTPSATGSRSASLDIVHSGLNSPVRVSVTGIGLASGPVPAVSIAPASLSFVALHTGQTSSLQTVTVSNLGGLAPLEVGVPTINSTQYALQNNCLTPVAIDASCTITVRFTPNAAGPAPATLSIPTNVPSTPVATATLQGRGFAGAPAVSAGVRASDGFPDWFGDDNGVRVEPCLPQSDPNCIVLGDAGFDPGLPLDFPANYPTEFFYQIADSDLIGTDGCGGTTAPGTAHLRLALEGSFANGFPEVGQQINFARSRVGVTSGLCANTSYTFTTPYGPFGPFFTNAGGGIVVKDGTIDTNPPIPSDMLSNGFLQWDPAVGPAAPVGYLGDALTFHKVVGSRYVNVAAGETEPANYFGIDGTTMRTDLFIVSGKLAADVTSTPSTMEFGNVNELTTSVAQTMTLTNASTDAVSGFVPTLAGPNAADFVITGGTCGAGSIQPLVSCTVTVAFAPRAINVASVIETATLSVAHSGLNSPNTVALSGTAVNVAQAAVTLNPTSVTWASQNVGTVSPTTTVTVTNSGFAPLIVSGVALGGANPTQFRIVSTTCDPLVGIPVGLACAVQVAFAPTSGGAKSAQLQLTDNAPTSPQLVGLSGTALAASLSTSPTSLAFGTIGLGGSPTKTINITNTGTANLTITGLTITGSTAFTMPSHSCTALVLPGKNCSVSIRFSPTAKIAYSATLNIVSNAAPATVSLTGTGK